MSGTANRLAYRVAATAFALAVTACTQDVTTPLSRDLGSPSNAVTTTSEIIVDTGPAGTEPGPVVIGGDSEVPGFQFLGGQFTLTQPANVESVAGWLKVFAAGSMDVHIRSDAGGVPGTDIHSQNYSLTLTSGFGWYEFTGYNVSLTAGTYWLTFEPVIDGGAVASMPNGAPSPLSSYAFRSTSLPNWSHAFGPTPPTLGFRVTAAVPETPAQMIGDLGSFVGGLGLSAGTTSSIDSKLQLALGAINNNQTGAACSYLQDVMNFTRAQSGKKISTTNANAIQSRTSAIRSGLSC